MGRILSLPTVPGMLVSNALAVAERLVELSTDPSIDVLQAATGIPVPIVARTARALRAFVVAFETRG